MKTPSDDRDSRLRQALHDLREELVQLHEIFVAREPIMAGSVYELNRKCGKPSCHCAVGTALHSCLVISWTAKGRKRLRTVPNEQRVELMALTHRYRRFRKARARLLGIHSKILAIVDRLEAVRRKEP
jgi:hypothetical protein